MVASLQQYPLQDTCAAALPTQGRRSWLSISPMLHLDIVVGLAKRAQGPSYGRNLKRWQRKQSRRKAYSYFLAALEEHVAIMSVNAGIEGGGESCTRCGEPIYGMRCEREVHQPMHWGCAGCPRPDWKCPPREDIESSERGGAPEIFARTPLSMQASRGPAHRSESCSGLQTQRQEAQRLETRVTTQMKQGNNFRIEVVRRQQREDDFEQRARFQRLSWRKRGPLLPSRSVLS